MENQLLFEIGKLIFGLAILVLSGDYLVKGGVAIARHCKISTLLVGLTVVAFGTSAPELIVSSSAALTGHPELALGNVIGSNIANIALILGLTVIILPMAVAKSTIKQSCPIMLISGIALFLFMKNDKIGWVEGLILFICLIFFLVSSYHISKKDFAESVESVEKPEYALWLSIVMVLLASGGLALGSNLLVKSASALAVYAGISERIISLTLVAFGTSIPELTASIIAAAKKESDISVGNIVGSNIFNVFAVIGIASMLHPINFQFADFRFDLICMIAISFMLFLFVLPYKQFSDKGLAVGWKSISGGKIGRVTGVVLLASYGIYLYMIL